MAEVVDRSSPGRPPVWGYAADRPPGRGLAGRRRRAGAVHPGAGPGQPVPPGPRRAGRRHRRTDAGRRRGHRSRSGCSTSGWPRPASIPSGGVALDERKPEWLRVKARMGEEYRSLRRTMRQLDLVTVCEEAGCPNIYECWADGTATFMINGDRCTRACGFCLVDTRKPLAPDPDEPERVAEAVARLGLAHAVVTTVARDDLPDGGAGAFAATVRGHPASGRPATAVELLISDCKGRPGRPGDDLRGRPGRPQPQRRDRPPPAAGRAPVGVVRPQPGRAGPGQGGRAHHQVGSDRRDGRDASTR